MPASTRLIARLDIKGSMLIKGVCFEGLRVIGDPYTAALKYYDAGVDEILFVDAVASLYGRNTLAETVSRVVEAARIPLTVGGGIKSLDDAEAVLRSGADRLAVNTAAIQNPELITDLARAFGSSCTVVSIQAQRSASGNAWEALAEYGRQRTGVEVVKWAAEAVDRGAGEILLSSVDQDGTQRGFDIKLVQEVASKLSVPVIASGGMGSVADLVSVVRDGKASAVAVASVLHHNIFQVREIKRLSQDHGIFFEAH